MAYRDPHTVVKEVCAEWRELGLGDDPMGVAMEVIDRLATQEGLLDADGYGEPGAVDLAATEWMSVAEHWFEDNPVKEVV